MPWTRRAAAIALVAGALACAREPAAVDLLALFPFTDAGQVTDVIDLGTPAADAHLRGGWSAAETLPSGDSGAWTVERRASVQLALPEPRDRRLVVRCGLLGPEAPRIALVTLGLHGRRVGMLRVRPELAEITVPLPGRLQRPGLNVIDFSNPLVSDLPRSARAQRARAVAVDWIRVVGGDHDAPHATLATDDPATLVVPAGARVDFHLRLPRAAEIAAAVARDGDAGLRVAVEEDGAPARVVVDAARPGASIRAALGGRADALARLSIEATGTGAIRLRRPVVLGQAPAVPAPSAWRAPRDPPSVVLYLVDTLRTDALGCYGGSRAASPSIDALAADAIVYTRALAQSSWTRPATASILSGRNPAGHGAVTIAAAIRPDVPMVAEVLRAHGYRTGAFVTNVNVRGDFGFARGFEEYVYLPETKERPTLHVPAGELVERAGAWLDQHAREPFFLYVVHASDPHAPYRPPADVAERVRPPGPRAAIADADDPLRELVRHPAARTAENLAWVRALYDGDVAVADAGLGALVARLKALGVWERTIVVVVADHGEEFLDHGGLEHGRTLYRELVAVPLILRLPGGEGRGTRVADLARQVDVAPTLLAAVGLPAPPGMDGAPLPPLAPAAAREAFAQTALGPVDVMVLTSGDWTVIDDVRGPHDRFELYDVAADPAEQHDVATERPVPLGYGRELLARAAVAVPRRPFSGAGAEPFSIDADTARRLKALGYVGR